MSITVHDFFNIIFTSFRAPGRVRARGSLLGSWHLGAPLSETGGLPGCPDGKRGGGQAGTRPRVEWS